MVRQFSYLFLIVVLSLTACQGKNQPNTVPAVTATPVGNQYAISWRDERKALIREGISIEVREILSAGEVSYAIMSLDSNEDPVVIRKILKDNGIAHIGNIVGPTDLTFFAIIQPTALNYLTQLESEGSLLFVSFMPPGIKMDSDLIDRAKDKPFGVSKVYIKLFVSPDDRQKKELESFLFNTYFPRIETVTSLDGDIDNFNLDRIVELPYVIDVGPSGGELIP